MRRLGLVLLVLVLAAPAAAQSVRVAPPGGGPKTGTKSCTTSAAAIVSTATPVLSVTLRNTSTTIGIVVGDSAAQDYTLTPGAALSFDVADLSQVYCKTASSTATLEYFAIKGP